MASFNRVILLGNLTRDPEIRYTPNGTPVMDIGLAVNERRRNPNGEWVDEPVFVEVTLWGRTAEVANEYLSKGSPVLIEGRLRLDTWETSDGQRRSRLRVVAERMQMLGRAMGADQAVSAADRGESASTGEVPRDVPDESAPFDDLPF